MADALFSSIQRFHGDRPWGRVLDAGTGKHSLDWCRSLGADEVVAITGSKARAKDLGCVLGNWTDPTLLAGEGFDVVLADYLIGAIDGFAPYFQSRLLGRLRPLVRDRLYVVGLEPLEDVDNVVTRIARLRDACILLAGHRTYREYPRAWVLRNLESSGYRVLDSWSIPIVYKARWVHGQLDVAKRKLPWFRDRGLAAAMGEEIERVRGEALAAVPLQFGEDYVVAAAPV